MWYLCLSNLWHYWDLVDVRTCYQITFETRVLSEYFHYFWRIQHTVQSLIFVGLKCHGFPKHKYFVDIRVSVLCTSTILLIPWKNSFKGSAVKVKVITKNRKSVSSLYSYQLYFSFDYHEILHMISEFTSRTSSCFWVQGSRSPLLTTNYK